jgi:hypothetical protein
VKYSYFGGEFTTPNPAGKKQDGVDLDGGNELT